MKQLIFSFFFIFLFANLFAQNSIELKIDYSDSTNFKYKKNIFLKDTTLAKTFLFEKVKDLKSSGYISASNDEFCIDSNFINSRIFVGEKYLWGNIHFDSLEFEFLNNRNFKFSLFSNKIFNENSLSKFTEKLLKIYENNGFPFVKLKLEDIDFEQNKITADLKIEKGDFYTIDSINWTGDLKLSKNILYSFIEIKPKDIYNETKIQNISQKLKNISFINYSKPLELRFSEQKTIIDLFLEKKKANNFSAIIGFIPNHNVVGKLLLTGELNLLLYNSLKFAEKLSFNWQKIDESSQKIDVLVNIPYLYKLPIGTETSLILNKKDTSYLNSTFNLLLNYHLSNNSSANIFFKNKSSNVLSEFVNSSTIANFDIRLFGFGFEVNTLDYIFNPTKGYFLNTKIGVGNKNTIGETNVTKTQIELESSLTYYKKIYKNFVLKVSNKTAFMKLYNESNYNFYENEAFKIGGLKTLRGFDEEQILATSFSIFTGEIRYIFEENSAIYLFSDAAFIEQNFENKFLTDTPFGIGAGIDFETKAGIFTLNYAIGKQLGNPFLLKTAKIHFGFVSRF